MSDRLTIKVAVYLILQRDNMVLFSRRFNTGWADGKLSLPSGHVDRGELPTEAAVRELKEEVGISVDINDLKIAHISYRKDLYVDFYYIVESFEGEPQNLERDKCSELKWVDLENKTEEFAPTVFESTQRALANKNFYSEFIDKSQ